MKNVVIYVVFILFLIILLPLFLVKGCELENKDRPIEDNNEKILKGLELVKIYNTKTGETEEMLFEEYIKGVVAAEMPAAFHIEALKAQAVAARTYALTRIERFKEGNPDHPTAPLCTGVHCQAYLTLPELEEIHGESWTTEYWPKINRAVDETKNIVVTFEGELIEAIYHSTSGGYTEDSENVFSTAKPYLRSVPSPNEESSPRFKNTIKMSFDDFAEKIKEIAPGIDITKKNVTEVIKVADKSETGRILKLMIGEKIVEGTEFRTVFGLNSTNFKISLIGDEIEIETLGNGHGVGMSQWGANAMAKEGYTFEEILKHYYLGVEVEEYN